MNIQKTTYLVSGDLDGSLKKTFQHKWQAQHYLNGLERAWIKQGAIDAGKPLDQFDWREALNNSDEFWDTQHLNIS